MSSCIGKCTLYKAKWEGYAKPLNITQIVYWYSFRTTHSCPPFAELGGAKWLPSIAVWYRRSSPKEGKIYSGISLFMFNFLAFGTNQERCACRNART